MRARRRAGWPRLGPWRLGTRLGPTTWAARHAATGEAAVLRAAPAGSPAAAAVAAEAAALAAVAHPNLARLAGPAAVLPAPGAPATGTGIAAVATRAFDGPTLADLAARAPLAWEDAAGLLAPVASALAALHGAGWLHGDLSAANVVVGPGGPVLVDLGCAAPAGAGRTTGTPGSTAPEVRAGRPVTAAAEVWALAATARAVAAGDPPAALAPVLAAALAPDPTARPSAAELAAALRAAVGPAGRLARLTRPGDPGGPRPGAHPDLRARRTLEYGPRPPLPTPPTGPDAAREATRRTRRTSSTRRRRSGWRNPRFSVGPER